jgi:hypothetical protein
MRLSDANYSFFYLSGDWRELARCREVDIEMLPGKDGHDKCTGTEVQQAKQTCASCPVMQECRALGGTQMGVWGGLTKDERDRLRLGNQPSARPYEKRYVIKCEDCGFACVPALKNHNLCDDCLPVELRPKNTEEHKEEILKLLAEGKTHKEVALKLGFRVNQIGMAARNWEVKPQASGMKTGGKRDRNALAPCGTPAARRRHQRRNEPIVTCACAQPGSSNPERTMKNGWVA